MGTPNSVSKAGSVPKRPGKTKSIIDHLEEKNTMEMGNECLEIFEIKKTVSYAELYLQFTEIILNRGSAQCKSMRSFQSLTIEFQKGKKNNT